MRQLKAHSAKLQGCVDLFLEHRLRFAVEHADGLINQLNIQQNKPLRAREHAAGSLHHVCNDVLQKIFPKRSMFVQFACWQRRLPVNFVITFFQNVAGGCALQGNWQSIAAHVETKNLSVFVMTTPLKYWPSRLANYGGPRLAFAVNLAVDNILDVDSSRDILGTWSPFKSVSGHTSLFASRAETLG